MSQSNARYDARDPDVLPLPRELRECLESLDGAFYGRIELDVQHGLIVNLRIIRTVKIARECAA